MNNLQLLKEFHLEAPSNFAALHSIFTFIKKYLDSNEANDLIEAIELNKYWVKKEIVVDSSDTLAFLQTLADWIEKQLCLNNIKPKTDLFGLSVIKSNTNLTLPEYEKLYIGSHYEALFSDSKNSMMYVDITHLKILIFEEGAIVEKSAKSLVQLQNALKSTLNHLRYQADLERPEQPIYQSKSVLAKLHHSDMHELAAL